MTNNSLPHIYTLLLLPDLNACNLIFETLPPGSSYQHLMDYAPIADTYGLWHLLKNEKAQPDEVSLNLFLFAVLCTLGNLFGHLFFMRRLNMPHKMNMINHNGKSIQLYSSFLY